MIMTHICGASLLQQLRMPPAIERDREQPAAEHRLHLAALRQPLPPAARVWMLARRSCDAGGLRDRWGSSGGSGGQPWLIRRPAATPMASGGLSAGIRRLRRRAAVAKPAAGGQRRPKPPGRVPCTRGRRYHGSALICCASAKSACVSPPAEWVDKVSVTLFHAIAMSG